MVLSCSYVIDYPETQPNTDTTATVDHSRVFVDALDRLSNPNSKRKIEDQVKRAMDDITRITYSRKTASTELRRRGVWERELKPTGYRGPPFHH
jgi:hypothetical protein